MLFLSSNYSHQLFIVTTLLIHLLKKEDRMTMKELIEKMTNYRDTLFIENVEIFS